MRASLLSLLQSVRFGSVCIARITSSSGTLGGAALSPLLGSSDRDQQMRLYVVRAGECTAITDLGEHRVPTGHAVFGFSDEPELRVRTACELLVIDAPIELMHQAFGPGFSERSAPLERASQLIEPVVAFASQILANRRTEYSNLSRYYVERLLQEMLLGLLLDIKRSSKSPVASSPYLLAQAIIEARSSDASLSTDVIAEEVRLSRRQLERLFQQNGTTVAREIRRTRVNTAVSLLCDEAYADLGVEEIAHFVGYGAGSSLARAMAAEGLPSPSAVRKRAA